ncbi:hypothetical protein SAMN04487949_2011 [Halogranum gelatinilyticum]|uniref:Uncharacterized protein n=1 Tax=Halogranum gelatinilyticum TaxID=660521 RepID=A0A1G9U2B9_9EURY|nr:hypothetical protein [Halogranum gelatinilyticum]SDM54127.1 hypothetical protein SAMN04487949_2011 [Halogranum gelatinilyticum]
MEPDSYRWEETVYVYDADAELGDEPTAEFDWGFSLRVDRP